MGACRVRVVLLDLDGTLIDTMDLYTAEASRIISEATGATTGEAERLYKATAGMPFRDQLRLAGAREDLIEYYAGRFEEWKRRLLRSVEVPGRAIAVVEELRAMGLKVYVSTNNECRVIQGLLPPAFDGVLCNDPEKGMRKGRPHLEEVLRREGVEPCQVLFIGDSDYDIKTYKELGVKVLKTRGLWRDAEIIDKIHVYLE